MGDPHTSDYFVEGVELPTREGDETLQGYDETTIVAANGNATIMTPLTPLFTGSPTAHANWPLESYSPQLDIMVRHSPSKVIDACDVRHSLSKVIG